jgi:similar to stage IV sporulation protein
LLHRLVRYLLGGLRLELRGQRVAEFINRALQDGIPLWHLVARPDRTLVTVPPGRFADLRPIARATRTRVRSVGRSGLPFRLQRLRFRHAFLAGIVLVLAALWWASGHVWVVQVRGTVLTDPRAVAAAAARLGLQPGVWRSGVDIQALQRDLPVQVGSLTWAAVKLQGVRAIITVVEKRSPVPLDPAHRLDIVAAKPGTVLQVVPLSGQPLVKPGDQVQVGQPLILGQLMIWAGGRPMVLPGTAKPPRETVAKELPAQGYVRARVTYDLRVEVRRQLRHERPLESASRWRLKWGEKEILLGKALQAASGQEVQVHRLGNWRIPGLPVEIQRERHDQVQVTLEPLPEKAVLQAAQEKVIEQLIWSLPPDSEVESVVAAILAERGEQALVQVKVVTIENIGQPMAPTGGAISQP